MSEPEAEPSTNTEAEQNRRPEETQPGSSKASTRPPSPAVLIIGFVIIAMLGVLITQGMLPKGSSGSGTNSPVVESLQADLETARAALNRQRLSMGLEPLSGMSSAESADEVAARLEADSRTLASIAKSFEDMLIRREKELDDSRAETVAALKEQRRLREMVDAANQELREAMIDASRASTMTSDLERANRQVAALQEEVARLQVEPDDLRRQLIECNQARTTLEQQVTTLRAQLTQASLFASTESELLKEGVALFQALRKLQGKSESELASAYSQFGVDLGANVLRTCKFETGSSAVSPELENLLIQIPQEAPSNSMIFVVGYASETGNVDSNRTLSSDRATHVARVLDAAKLPTQKVQAAYLGQTSRFDRSVPEHNQLVEIWQIVPRS